jgi:hypothetical protein
MHKGPRNEAKNAIDNPENVGDIEDNGNQESIHAKKDIRNQIQESNTQMSFKVTFRHGLLLLSSLFFMCARKRLARKTI